MTDLSKLTAKDFSDAMHKGWGELGYCKNHFFQTKDKASLCPWEWEKASKCCALGAMAYALKTDANSIQDSVDFIGEIAEASNDAGNKRAAMKAVDAILLNQADYLAVKK